MAVWLAMSAFLARYCSGKEWTFTIDPQLSRLELSGQFAGVTLIPQDAEGKSPIAAVGGWMSVDLDDPNRATWIALKENSLLVENSGDWLPEPRGGPAVGELGEPTAANLAMWFNDPVIGQGWGAIRNLEFQLLADGVAVSGSSFPAAPRIDTLQGEFDYNVPSVALADRGQEVLRENPQTFRAGVHPSKAMHRAGEASAFVVSLISSSQCYTEDSL
jgi:hypothetical protein